MTIKEPSKKGTPENEVHIVVNEKITSQNVRHNQTNMAKLHDKWQGRRLFDCLSCEYKI
jgi:hypothetical protein